MHAPPPPACDTATLHRSRPLPYLTLLDHWAFPHIVDRVLDYLCDASPLAAVRLQTISRPWHDKIGRRLFRHVRIHHHTDADADTDTTRTATGDSTTTSTSTATFTVSARAAPDGPGIRFPPQPYLYPPQLLHPGIRAALRKTRVLDFGGELPPGMRRRIADSAVCLEAVRVGPVWTDPTVGPLAAPDVVVSLHLRQVDLPIFALTATLEAHVTHTLVAHLSGMLIPSVCRSIEARQGSAPRALVVFYHRPYDSPKRYDELAAVRLLALAGSAVAVTVVAAYCSCTTASGSKLPVWDNLRREVDKLDGGQCTIRFRTCAEYKEDVGKSKYWIHAFVDPAESKKSEKMYHSLVQVVALDD